ncbi:sulfate reduction electron transfer complex DsrMKJOP subunit DsrO [Desulfonema magnum]|uniref:Redox complex linked to DsrAB, iron-sulfur binding subunit n=1 Tax=Desulfonema magnum TaxID=45655 RepID=A0A975GKP3_9BACT|nr:4Fe-4S dicluster domain-containing protein [Desulfonema magnum]QTA84867.1 putative redox complex linked to DsrAB, iron-sulfur binding subunit [Desulfonema magnum]
MESNRRKFLKVAGISALGIAGAKPVLNAFASEQEEEAQHADVEIRKNEKALTARQWAMVIDTRKLQSEEDLKPIIEACHKTHNVPDVMDTENAEYDEDNQRHVIKWIWEEEYKHAFPTKSTEFLDDRLKNLPFLVLCNHCENPPCVRVCPTKATFKREDGIVLMDFHRCIGCRFCMAACPYGSRSFNFRDPREFIKDEDRNPEFPTRMKGVVEKCNFCAERLAVGKQPACVEASNGAIAFGDLYDPESEVRQLLKSNYTIRRKQGLGTGPAIYYIV